MQVELDLEMLSDRAYDKPMVGFKELVYSALLHQEMIMRINSHLTLSLLNSTYLVNPIKMKTPTLCLMNQPKDMKTLIILQETTLHQHRIPFKGIISRHQIWAR